MKNVHWSSLFLNSNQWTWLFSRISLLYSGLIRPLPLPATGERLFRFSLQIQSIAISFVVGLSGGDHSLQRLVSSRIASKLSIDTIYDSSARKYYEYIIKSVEMMFIICCATVFSLSYFSRKMKIKINFPLRQNNCNLLIKVISKPILSLGLNMRWKFVGFHLDTIRLIVRLVHRFFGIQSTRASSIKCLSLQCGLRFLQSTSQLSPRSLSFFVLWILSLEYSLSQWIVSFH